MHPAQGREIWIVKLRGIDSLTESETLRGQTLLVSSTDRPELEDEDEFLVQVTDAYSRLEKHILLCLCCTYDIGASMRLDIQPTVCFMFVYDASNNSTQHSAHAVLLPHPESCSLHHNSRHTQDCSSAIA